MKNISFGNVKIGGFWGRRTEINRTATLDTVYNRFKDTGRFDAVACNWREGMPNKPHIFWDSDIAKWIEAAAYSIRYTPDSELERKIDETVDLIAANQTEDGYFNSYYLSVEPENRFTQRDNHELYCAGHLTEAAIAYYEATGKDKFLKVMCKYIDLIERIFKDEDSAAFCTPGHEEIELALVRLYDCTGEKRYLELSRHFIEQRGRCEKDLNCRNWCGSDYDQSEVPVREQKDAHGHSVRAAYLYCGMADIAARTGDKSLFDACDTIFDNIINKRMYITGGIGSSSHGEAFADDYVLPNDVAYSETCASIALALFARRMSAICPDSKYADAAERAIYNSVLAGVSLDGHAFFYVNPLEINIDRHNVRKKFYESRENLLTERIEVFGCSCCPPNLARFVSSIGDFLYTIDENTLYIHHYMESEAEFEGIKVLQQTRYPCEGGVRITVSGMKGKTVAVRIPGWTKYVSLNGEKLDARVEKGYAYIDITKDEQLLDFWFEMKARLVASNPLIDGNEGRAALCRGPVVYCAESVLNDNIKLNNVILDRNLSAGLIFNEEVGTYEAKVKGFVDKPCDELYFDLDCAETEEKEIRMLPYYGYANHGESDMLVWFRVTDK